jgi:hypothetical protein
MPNATCSIPACTTPQRSRGLCRPHYDKARRGYGFQPGQELLRVDANASLDERLRHHGWTVTASGCWEWDGFRMDNGYGQMAVGANKKMLATRAAYRAWVGELPDDMAVCHRCDNPPCINPKHFFLGTKADNNADMASKLRVANGERSGRHKLSDAEVEQIRRDYAAGGEGQQSIADRFGVTISTVSVIVNYKSRKSLTHPVLS